MAGTASILMRAFRSANSSFHTWRAGSFDPTMSDAVGDQAPPFPTGDYSDHVAIAFLEGPLARSDSEAFDVIGSSGSPVTFALAPAFTSEALPGTDCRDYASVTYWIYITNPGTATLLSVFGSWAGVDAALATDHASQKSDDAISSGVSPQNTYQADYSMPPTGNQPLGPFNLPVRGRRARLRLQADTNNVQGYVTAMRLA